MVVTNDFLRRDPLYSIPNANRGLIILVIRKLLASSSFALIETFEVSRIDRSKNVIALFVGDTYDEIDSDIVQIDSRADVIIFSSSVVTAKMDLMQRFFGFSEFR